MPTQFLDKRIKFIFAGDNWIKLKYWHAEDLASFTTGHVHFVFINEPQSLVWGIG